MSSTSITEPSARSKWVAATLVIFYTFITLLPLLWIISTSFKTGPDSISYPPKIIFQPSIEGYVNLFTNRTRATPEQLATMAPLRTSPKPSCVAGTRSSPAPPALANAS